MIKFNPSYGVNFWVRFVPLAMFIHRVIGYTGCICCWTLLCILSLQNTKFIDAGFVHFLHCETVISIMLLSISWKSKSVVFHDKVNQGGRSCATARPPVSASEGAPALAGSPSIRAFVAKSVLSRFTRFWMYFFSHSW